MDNIKVECYKIEGPWSKLKMGEYKETSVDVQKREVDFRLLQTNPFVIRWIDGKTETVNKRTLEKLQQTHTWATDF